MNVGVKSITIRNTIPTNRSLKREFPVRKRKPEIKPEIDVTALLMKICQLYEITLEQMLSGSRKPILCSARYIAMYYLAYRKNYTHRKIGDILGHRERTTILGGLKEANIRITLNRRYGSWADFNNKLNKIMKL